MKTIKQPGISSFAQDESINAHSNLLTNRIKPHFHLKYHSSSSQLRKYASTCQTFKFSKYADSNPPLRLLRRLRLSQHSSFELSRCTSSDLIHISRILTNIDRISSLNITLKESLTTSQHAFHPISKAIQQLRGLNSLKLKFIWSEISNLELRSLTKALYLQKSLRNLSLFLNYGHTSNEKDLTYFSNKLSKFTHLESLEVGIEYSRTMIDHKASYLFGGLSQMKRLKILKFKACHRNIDGAYLRLLANSLKSISTLTTLELSFQSCYKINDSDLEFITEIFPLLHALVNLSIDLAWCEYIGPVSIKSLCIALNSSRSLQKLKLDLRGCGKIDDLAVSLLLTSISNLSILNILSINFGDGKMMSSSAFQDLAIQIPVLQDLRHLKLLFDVCKFMDDTLLESIAKAISSLVDLEDLFLLVHLGGVVTDNGVIEIAKIFESVRKLRLLRINFYMYKTITSQGISHLARTLVNLKDLQLLSITFAWSYVGKEGAISLGLALMELNRIKDLQLSFYACNEVEDEGFIQISKAMALMEELSILRLDFGGCKITNKGTRYLGDSIYQLKCLRELKLSFNCCKGIGDKGIWSICHMVKYIRSLKILELDFEGSSGSAMSKETIKTVSDGLPYLESFSFRATAEDVYV